MKKLFAFLAIAGIMAACNEKAESTESTDSTTIVTPPSSDSMSMSADSAMRAADSTMHPDSMK